MEGEIREQPELLRRNAASYFAQISHVFRDRRFEMVVLAARGSSDNAALYARYLIEVHLAVPVVLAAPSVLTKYGTKVSYHNCLGIGISQSGAAPDVAEVLNALAESGNLTLAITNTPLSKITRVAAHTLLLNIGEERSVAATKTYSASLVAAYQVARALGAKLPPPDDRLPSEDWLEIAHETASKACGPVIRNPLVFTLGRGFGFSTANEAALKLMECALISAKSFSSADFEHGPKALAGPGSVAVSFDGDRPGLREQGCEILLPPTPSPTVPEELRPVWDTIFAQWLALLAARARGLDPDQPEHLQKITQTL